MIKESTLKDPATVIAKRMAMLFEVVELTYLEKWGFKLLRQIVRESGYRTETVIRAIEHGKKLPSYYGITLDHITDSIAFDGAY